MFVPSLVLFLLKILFNQGVEASINDPILKPRKAEALNQQHVCKASSFTPRKEKGWLEGDKSTTHDIAVKLQTSLKPYEQGNKHIKQKRYAFERPCAIPSKVQLNM